MFRLLAIVCLWAIVSGSLDVYNQCIQNNDKPVTNDYLEGIWHIVYRFSILGPEIPVLTCSNITFTIPNAEQVNTYKRKYDNLDLPFTLEEKWAIIAEDNVGVSHARKKGMYWGQNGAKYFVLDPSSVFGPNMFGFDVGVFEKIDKEFMVFSQTCLMRDKWLLSRDRYAPLKTLLSVIDSSADLKNMNAQRFCVPS